MHDTDNGSKPPDFRRSRMKIKTILAACIMVLASLSIVGASTATADDAAQVNNRVCAATGTLTLDKGLSVLPPVGPPHQVDVRGSGTFDCGPIEGEVDVRVELDIASCGESSGRAWIDDEPATVTTTLSLIEVTGANITVRGNAVSDPNVPNNSCTNGTAKVFQVTAAGTIH